MQPAINICQSGTGCSPYILALSPDNSLLFIGLYNSNQIAVFNTTTDTVSQYVSLSSSPTSIAVSPDGYFVYVLANNTVIRLFESSGSWKIDSSSEVVAGNGSKDLVVSPDGTTGYVSNYMDQTVVSLNLTVDPIAIIDTYSITLPSTLALTPDGNTLYVASTNTIIPIYIPTKSVLYPISFSNGPSANAIAMEVAPDGSSLWAVSYFTNEVVQIPTASNLALTSISFPTGANLMGIAISLAVSRPGPPQNLNVLSENGALQISWAPPLSNGGSAISSYVISIDGPNGPPAPINVSNSTLSHTATGLTNMAGYKVSVQAVNTIGTGPAVVSSVIYPQITAGEYVPLVPSRILDTRTGNGTGGVIGPLGPSSTLNLQVTGRGGVPSTGVFAVVMNVTGANATQISYLTAYPTGTTRPVVSNLNLAPSQPATPNLVTVKVGSSGQVSIFNFQGTVNVIADVVGYYTDGTTPAASRFIPLPPVRILDTRRALGVCQPSPCATIGPNGSLTVAVAGQGGVPIGQAVGVIMNVTATNPTATSYLTVYPSGQSQPLASNLNFVAGQTVPNLVASELGTNGNVTIYNAFGSIDVLIDVVGYYDIPGSINGARFTPLNPIRILDTRTGLGTCVPAGCPTLSTKSTLTLQVTGISQSAPSGASGAIMNVTAVNPTALSYLTIYPSGQQLPLASDLNFISGQTVPNLVESELSSSGQISIYNNSGNVDVLVDIAGWFNDGSS